MTLVNCTTVRINKHKFIHSIGLWRLYVTHIIFFSWPLSIVCFRLQVKKPSTLVEASWNVMAHAQKPDFVFRGNGRVHLNRRGLQFSRLRAAEVCASAFVVGSNAGYTMFRSCVNGTGYSLHSPVSTSLPLPCVIVCHHSSSGVYTP